MDVLQNKPMDRKSLIKEMPLVFIMLICACKIGIHVNKYPHL